MTTQAQNDAKKAVEALAQQMGVTVGDVMGFTDCLRVWLAKGYSLEKAIEKHMGQMVRVVNNAHKFPQSVAVDAFFPGGAA